MSDEHEERIDLSERGYALHVIPANLLNDYEVWLNTEVADFDGLCVGVGKTRSEAMTKAAATLEDTALALRDAVARAVSTGESEE